MFLSLYDVLYFHHFIFRYLKLKDAATGATGATGGAEDDSHPPAKKKKHTFYSKEEEDIIINHFKLRERIPDKVKNLIGHLNKMDKPQEAEEGVN